MRLFNLNPRLKKTHGPKKSLKSLINVPISKEELKSKQFYELIIFYKIGKQIKALQLLADPRETLNKWGRILFDLLINFAYNFNYQNAEIKINVILLG